jgi:CO/xanthine dehydrogenase Mo-binding subunit
VGTVEVGAGMTARLPGCAYNVVADLGAYRNCLPRDSDLTGLMLSGAYKIPAIR